MNSNNKRARVSKPRETIDLTSDPTVTPPPYLRYNSGLQSPGKTKGMVKADNTDSEMNSNSKRMRISQPGEVIDFTRHSIYPRFDRRILVFPQQALATTQEENAVNKMNSNNERANGPGKEEKEGSVCALAQMDGATAKFKT